MKSKVVKFMSAVMFFGSILCTSFAGGQANSEPIVPDVSETVAVADYKKIEGTFEHITKCYECCGDNGTECIEIEPFKTLVVFKEDGTGEVRFVDSEETESFKFTQNQETLVVNEEDPETSLTFNYSYDGKALVLELDGEKIELKKV